MTKNYHCSIQSNFPMEVIDGAKGAIPIAPIVSAV